MHIQKQQPDALHQTALQHSLNVQNPSSVCAYTKKAAEVKTSTNFFLIVLNTSRRILHSFIYVRHGGNDSRTMVTLPCFR